MKRNTGLKWLAGLAGFAGAIALADALLLERYFFTIKRFSLGNTDAEDVEPLKIIHLSDLHLRQDVGIFHRKLTSCINKLRPDLILITGDSIDQTGVSPPLEKFLRLLDSEIPKIAIMGNHEYKAGIEVSEMEEIFEKVNGRLLVDKTEKVSVKGTTLTLTGLDDVVLSHSDFREAVKDTGYEKNHLVLLHSPKHYDLIRKEAAKINKEREEGNKLNIYCALAGHTHGGQVTPLNGEPIVLPDMSGNYNRGWYGDKPPYLYISKGFGVAGVPFRFGARAEITFLSYYPF